LKQPLLALALAASCLAPAAGFAQQRNTFTPEIDNFSCAPPYGPVANVAPMSRQNTVEQVVAPGGRATLCLTRDSSLVLATLHCRITEGAGAASPTGGTGPQAAGAPEAAGPAMAPGGGTAGRAYGCQTGLPCAELGGFLGGARQPTPDETRTRFCMRYLNTGGGSQTVRVDFVFNYPGR
jgi:hypothetical protein